MLHVFAWVWGTFSVTFFENASIAKLCSKPKTSIFTAYAQNRLERRLASTSNAFFWSQNLWVTVLWYVGCFGLCFHDSKLGFGCVKKYVVGFTGQNDFLHTVAWPNSALFWFQNLWMTLLWYVGYFSLNFYVCTHCFGFVKIFFTCFFAVKWW